MIALVAALALAGELDAQLGVDSLTATSTHTGPGAGDPDSFAASELGLRVRADLHELDDRLHAELDYRGREPVAGPFPNQALRLLWKADVRYGLADGIEVGAGRFLAPTVVLLPTDGARLTVGGDRTKLTGFAGRRAITTSRTNVALGTFLPSAGLHLAHVGERVQLDVTAAYAGDELFFSGASAGVHRETASGPLAHARGSFVASDAFAVGGQASFASQATYLIGPTWSEHVVEVTAVDLWNALAWADWRPVDRARFDASVLGQSVGLYGAGLTTEPLDDLREPRFLDSRLRASFAPVGTKIGWLRVDGRHRLRHDRTELRYGGAVELNHVGIEGPFARAGAQIDDVLDPDDPVVAGAVDRLYWNAAAGWSQGAVQAEVGASVTDRAASPVSGRQLDPAQPGAPTSSDDLSPFVLEAQEVLFLRGFYAGRRFFGGVDLERGLADGELRAFVQMGLLTRTRW